MSNWQIWVNNEAIEANTEQVKKWISTGYIQATDKIKRDNLNWLEICRVPEFRDLFSLPPLASQTIKPETPDIIERNDQTLKPIYQLDRVAQILEATCYHSQLPPKYICTECGKAFCRECANLVTTGVNAVCQFCGSLCHTYKDATEKAKILLDQNTEFGKADFKAALDFPLGYSMQLLIISAICSFCLVIGFFGFPLASVLANTIMYYVTSVVIKNTMVGNLEEAIFDLSSLLAQPINPLLMGLGLQLVTTGPYELVHFLTVVQGEINAPTIVFSKYSAFFYPIFSVFTIPTILWVIFYYPIALLIAGITDSFKALVNPLVGLNTIKKIGKPFRHFFLSYLKVCLIVFPLIIPITLMIRPVIVFVVGAAMFIPFLNIFAVILVGALLMIPVVYANVMIAYLLGRIVFKSSKDLGVLV